MPSSPPGGTCGIYLVEKRPVQYWNELRSNNAFLGPLLNEQWNFFHVCPLVAGIVNFAIFLLRPDVGGIFHQVGRNIRFRPVISTSFQSLFEYLHISKKKYWTDKSPRWDLVFEIKSREWRKPRDQVNDIHFERMRLVCRLTQLSGRWKWNVTKRLSPLATTSSLSHVFPSEMNTSDFKNFHSTMI